MEKTQTFQEIYLEKLNKSKSADEKSFNNRKDQLQSSLNDWVKEIQSPQKPLFRNQAVNLLYCLKTQRVQIKNSSKIEMTEPSVDLNKLNSKQKLILDEFIRLTNLDDSNRLITLNVVQKHFRKTIKKLHPDLNPTITEEQNKTIRQLISIKNCICQWFSLKDLLRQ